MRVADFICLTHTVHRLVGLVVKASSSKAADLASNSAFAVGLFPSLDIPVTYKLALRRLPCQALGLVGLVSVYCDWTRQPVWSATSISVWRQIGWPLGLVGLVSIYCIWERQPVWSATSISVWRQIGWPLQRRF